jgi:hypothetical protein
MERTRGGLTANGLAVKLDMRYGIEIARARRSVDDFVRTAYAAIPFNKARNVNPPIGLDWCKNSDGSTSALSNHSGGGANIDLNALRRYLGLKI